MAYTSSYPLGLLASAAAGLLVLSLSAPARADALDEARTAGLVCEQPDGYALAVEPASADTKTLVTSINDKRKVQYAALAVEKGYPIEAVVLEVWDKRLKQYACK